MSAAALYTPGEGDFHVPVTVRLAGLPKGQQLAANLVYNAVIDCLRRGQIQTTEAVTDEFLRKNSPWLRGYSLRFIQKGLKILQDLEIIRRQRRHGRRIIIVLVRLRGRAKVAPKPKADRRPGPKPARTAPIPNLQNDRPATPEQIAAAAKAQAQATAATPMTPQEEAEGRAAWDAFRQERASRQQATTSRPRLRSFVDPHDPKLAQIKAELEAKEAARRAALAGTPTDPSGP